jgi:hypothetical protein
MWPFSAKSVPSDEKSDPRPLESRMRALELDWEDTYERIRRVLQRISKRAEVIEKAEKSREGSDANPLEEPTPDAGSPIMGRLSERQRSIQQQILKRRLK